MLGLSGKEVDAGLCYKKASGSRYGLKGGFDDHCYATFCSTSEMDMLGKKVRYTNQSDES